jgi:anti-anti-sigma factor
MKFTAHDDTERKRITLSGSFTFNDNRNFKPLLEMLRQDKPKSLELDFAEVEFIDSAGLGMLLLLRDECEEQRVRISIHAVRGQVEKIFLISKFDQLFALHP